MITTFPTPTAGHAAGGDYFLPVAGAGFDRPAYTPPALSGFVPFDVLGEPATATGLESGEARTFRALWMPNCFDASLRAVRAGRHTVRLLMEHQWDDPLADTADGSLMVWADAAGLRFTADDSPRGRLAAATIRAEGFRFCSMAAVPHVFRDYPAEAAGLHDGIPVRLVAAAELFEVSAVRDPACRGATIRFLPT